MTVDVPDNEDIKTVELKEDNVVENNNDIT